MFLANRKVILFFFHDLGMVTCFACKIRLLLMEKAKIVLKRAKYHHNIYVVFSYRYMVTSFALFYSRRISSTSIKIRLLSMEKAKIVFKKAKYHFNIYIFFYDLGMVTCFASFYCCRISPTSSQMQHL